MNTFYITKNENMITTIDSWFKLAPPEGGGNQWKDKHSAKEFAKYMINSLPYFPTEIDSIVSSLGVVNNKFVAEPECITDFEPYGFGKKGPRHHDMLLINEKLIIGVEAKATETLDEYVTAKFEKLNGTPNQRKRYMGLCRSILNRELDECAMVRYQLLSASAGTLIEAKKRNINTALCLIILFSSDITKQDHIDATRKDIEYFTSLLSKNPNGSFKTCFAPEVDLFVSFLVVPLI